MRRLNIISKLIRKAVVCKCLEKDKVKGKEFCIYKEDAPKESQPKYWPKHFKTKKEADDYLDQMEMFKNFSDKNKKGD